MDVVPAHFSRRTAWNRTPTELALASRHNLLDLTLSNPTTAGLDLAPFLDPALLANPAATTYNPDPLGTIAAREAVAGYYATHHAVVSPDHVVLTASTSESYAHLLRLLCDPGEEILIAQPSYPLFDYLADLADVQLRTFPFFFDHGWHIDLAALEQAITPRTRALVLVHPNNPTGHAAPRAERDQLRTLCEQHELALIVDEVFLDYPLDASAPIPSFSSEPTPVLTFVLSGLSKVAALPQMKVGWIVAVGPKAETAEALARLEIVADTFLSVNTPAQLCVPEWLRRGPEIQNLIRSRLRLNLAALQGGPVEVFAVQAGWSAVLRLPRTYQADDAASELLRLGVLAHPARFFGMPESNRVVVSLLPQPTVMAEALQRIGSASGS